MHMKFMMFFVLLFFVKNVTAQSPAHILFAVDLSLDTANRELAFDVINNIDIMMVIVSSTLLIMAVVIGKKPIISRWEGGYFVLAYVLYMVFLVYRG